MKRAILVFLTGMLLLCLAGRAFAQTEAPQFSYSSEANSGVRHEVCTSLLGTSVDTYYTGEYTFDTLSGLSGDALLQTLRTLMTSTHTHYTTYGDCRDLAVKTDCENGDGTSINLLYSSFVTDFQGYINNTKKGWNREHVWPVSLGGFNKNQTPGCDLHHIRPTDSSLNGTRGNDKYGYATGNIKQMYGTVVTGGAHGGQKGDGYMEPLDNVKGDVARICMYMYVRYGSEYSGCKSITNVFQSIEVLLQWHEMDPVDTWEMGRNEVVYAIQGNRNVFIDYPELVWLVFEQEVPSDITTPSGSTCTHKNTTVDFAVEASCGTDGYSGDTYCTDCGKLVAGGNVIPSTEHKNTEIRDAREAVCNMAGSSGDTYCLDCGKLVKVGNLIPATGEHTFGEWLVAPGGGQRDRFCTVCNYTETEEVAYTSGPFGNLTVICITAAAVVVIAGGVTAVIVIKKKHK